MICWKKRRRMVAHRRQVTVRENGEELTERFKHDLSSTVPTHEPPSEHTASACCKGDGLSGDRSLHKLFSFIHS